MDELKGTSTNSVYVVLSHMPHDSGDAIGVFSTYEAAAACARAEAHNEGALSTIYCVVQEWTIDGAMVREIEIHEWDTDKVRRAKRNG